MALKGVPIWKRVIIGKFREEVGGWCSNVLREGFGKGLWKEIRNKWKVFKSRVYFIREDEKRVVKFWSDRWCGDFTW